MKYILPFINDKKYHDIRFIFLLFVTFRIVDFIVIYLSPSVIPYLGFFPYKSILDSYHLPHIVTSLANFDGIHYINISRNGYATYAQAFFPLYPLSIKALSFLGGNSLLAGILISHLACLGGLITCKKYLDIVFPNKERNMLFIILLLLFPTSFFFGAVYTESLFFLLFSLSLYFHAKKNYKLSLLFSILTSSTRLMGIFLIIFYIIPLIGEYKNKHKIRFAQISHLFSPLFGLFIYMFYLFITTGDPLFFYHAQPAFGANRSTSIILIPQVLFRYFKIFTTAQWNYQYFISIVEFTLFVSVFSGLLYNFYQIVRAKKKDFSLPLFSMSLFSLINIVMPTLTGTLSSIPRYVLFSFSFFIFLYSLKNRYILLVIGILFAVLHVILLGFFSQGYFVS